MAECTKNHVVQLNSLSRTPCYKINFVLLKSIKSIKNNKKFHIVYYEITEINLSMFNSVRGLNINK